MNQLEIPLDKIRLLDFVAIRDAFPFHFDDLYIDGDKRAVVIVNPSKELVKTLGGGN